MEILFGKDIGFWVGVIAGIFILLHIPSCNKHWAARLQPLSKHLKKYHNLTLNLATIFALLHVILSFGGLVFGIWI
jgi:membrane protein DedA with SNARE-associated domain